METPELDARVLLCHAAGVTHEDYVANPNLPLSPEAAARFAADIERRLRGEPVSRMIGYREFYGRAFRIDQDTLDPRPDTETLIEAALDLTDQRGWRHRPIDILDLGTGSGCDPPHAARGTATRAGRRHGVSALARSTWRGPMPKRSASRRGRASSLQIGSTALPGASILSSRTRLTLLPARLPSLRRRSACTIRRWRSMAVPTGSRRIEPSPRRRSLCCGLGGSLLAEIGPDQADAVSALFKQVGLSVDASDGVWRDLAGRPQVVVSNA